MKKLSIMLIGLMLLLTVISTTNAATLDRGVSVSSMFIAGGSAPNAMMPSLKYQMAIDSYIGINNKYTTNYTTSNYQSIYQNDTYDNHNTIITVDADMGTGEISLTTNPYIFEDGSSQNNIDVAANMGTGQVTVNTGNTP